MHIFMPGELQGNQLGDHEDSQSDELVELDGVRHKVLVEVMEAFKNVKLFRAQLVMIVSTFNQKLFYICNEL